MPPSSRDLYFQLAIRADDDGFVQPNGVMRILGAGQDDLKILLAKRFILPFEGGVVVIKHWLIHNMIRKDRYKPTRFTEEKKSLLIKANGAYTETPATNRQPKDNQPATQVRLGKVSLGKDRIGKREAENPVTLASDPTPADISRALFDENNQNHQQAWENTLGWLLEKKIPLALADSELRKFCSYWSELNKTGKKMRWELQKTFEVNRRLATWFGNLKGMEGIGGSKYKGKNYDK